MFPEVKEFGLFDVFKRVWETGKPEDQPISLYKDQRIAGWRENYVYKLPSGEIVAVYDDITERKRVEEALQESEEKYRSLFNTAMVGMYRTTIEEGKVLEANLAFARIFGYETVAELKEEFYT
ncbi:MAG: PAS domain-containing protein [Deltaproteobacteria bacterium]|nr:PAS domain-containing protein [Deltaproteobacteria bacterium]